MLKIHILFAVIVVLLILSVLLVNGIALRLSERFHLQFDLTSNAVFSIGDDTRALLEALDKPVEIYVLSDEGGFSGSRYMIQAQRIISQYPLFSHMVSLEYVDYAANPAFAVNYPGLSLSHGDVIIQSGERIHQIHAANLFHFARTPDGDLTIVASRAEEAVTSGFLNVISEDRARVALLTGNGAADGTLFVSLLADNNYDVYPVSLTALDLEGFDVALLFSPTIDLTEEALRTLEAFLYNEGLYRKILFYSASAEQTAMPNLDMFLSEWGVAFSEGAVFETSAERTYQFQPFYPTVEYTVGRYADMLRDPSMPFLMPVAKPMELLFIARDGRHVETLLSFSETSGVRPAGADSGFTAEDAERRGPMPALVVSSIGATASDGAQLRSSFIVSASTGIFDGIALHNTSVTNGEYLLNLMSDLLGREPVVNIQPTALADRTLGITSAQAATLGVVLVGVVPLVILSTGVAVWFFRRGQ